MNVTALLVFTAIAGYVFSENCLRYKYLLPRDDGQRFYLRSLYYGLPFVLISFFISKFLYFIPTVFPKLRTIKVDAEENIFFIGFGTVVLSFFIAVVYNRWIGSEGQKQKFKEAVNRDDFDLILYESMENFHPVAVTMENRKVYVGILFDGFEPNTNNSYLTIVPLLSGYRDSLTLDLTLTIKYQIIIDLLKSDGHNYQQLSRYKMAFPRDKIVSLHLYNEELYDHVQGQLP